jgi:hypothetical protein
VEKIRMDDLAQLGRWRTRGRSTDCLNQLHVPILKAFAQNTLPDHAGGPEDQDVHDLIDRLRVRKTATSASSS